MVMIFVEIDDDCNSAWHDRNHWRMAAFKIEHLGWSNLETLNRQHNIDSKPLTAESEEEGLLWKHWNHESSEQRILHWTSNTRVLAKTWMFSCKSESVETCGLWRHVQHASLEKQQWQRLWWFIPLILQLQNTNKFSIFSLLENQDAFTKKSLQNIIIRRRLALCFFGLGYPEMIVKISLEKRNRKYYYI